jgi:hypothetical protein
MGCGGSKQTIEEGRSKNESGNGNNLTEDLLNKNDNTATKNKNNLNNMKKRNKNKNKFKLKP